MQSDRNRFWDADSIIDQIYEIKNINLHIENTNIFALYEA